MKAKNRLLTIIFIMALTALACGRLNIGIEEPTPTAAEEIVEPEDTPTPKPDSNPDQNAVRDETDKENYSDYWVEVEDARIGLRFAMPCFWVANIPSSEQDPSGLGGFSVNNFSQEFIFSLGPKRGGTVWEIGGLKFDIGYHTMSEFELAPTSSLEELAYALVNPDQEHGITSTVQIEINGTPSLQVNDWSTFGESLFYLIPFTNDLIILFGPSTPDHPDLQAILHSLALDTTVQVQLPTQRPADPPQGMDAPCFRGLLAEGQSLIAGTERPPLTGTLDCTQVTDADALMWLICNVKDSFISRNTQPLLGFMGEPFKIGYWQSEGVERTRDEALIELQNNHIPTDTSGLTFTMDRSLFPPLFGMQPEQIFPPDANIVEIVYSEGWGHDGQGAALLYFAEKPNGGYYFYGMVVGLGHFDK